MINATLLRVHKDGCRRRHAVNQKPGDKYRRGATQLHNTLLLLLLARLSSASGVMEDHPLSPRQGGGNRVTSEGHLDDNASDSPRWRATGLAFHSCCHKNINHQKRREPRCQFGKTARTTRHCRLTSVASTNKFQTEELTVTSGAQQIKLTKGHHATALCPYQSGGDKPKILPPSSAVAHAMSTASNRIER